MFISLMSYDYKQAGSTVKVREIQIINRKRSRYPHPWFERIWRTCYAKSILLIAAFFDTLTY
jgi:hypothetical protein